MASHGRSSAGSAFQLFRLTCIEKTEDDGEGSSDGEVGGAPQSEQSLVPLAQHALPVEYVDVPAAGLSSNPGSDSPEESGDDRQGPVETEDQLVEGEGGEAEAGLGQHWMVQRGEQGDVEQRVQAVQPDLNQVAGEGSVPSTAVPSC